MSYTAKKNIPGTNIKKGDTVDKATAERHGKHRFRADGDDYKADRAEYERGRAAAKRELDEWRRGKKWP